MFLTNPPLPAQLLERAISNAGKEWAWSVGDIPEVIEAARQAKLFNVGGPLQFRWPGATCECYWVEVNTIGLVSTDLPWDERVERAAVLARKQFEDLQSRFDFLTEGRSVFGIYLDEFEATGGKAEDAMCFVWYLEAQDGQR